MFILGVASLYLITISSLLTFIIQRHHLLICLLALEGVILTLSLLLVLQVSECEVFFILVVVSFGACEARLGLACLVQIIRSYGNDRIKILTSSK